jgi:hypothetical protein
MNGSLTLNSPEAAARNESLEQLAIIGRAGQMVDLEPDDVLSALGRDLPLMSVNGLYYKTLGIITRFTRPLGTLLILIIGIVATLRVIRNAPAAVLAKIRSAGATFSMLVAKGAVASSPFGWLWVLLGLVRPQDADDNQVTDVEDAVLILKSILPGPIGAVYNIVDSALETAGFAGNTLALPAVAGGNPNVPAAAGAAGGYGGLLTPLAPAAGASLTQTGAVAPTVAATTPRSAPAEVPFWQQAVGAMMPAVGALVGSIFGDDDHNITGTEGVVRDGALSRCAALALAAGVPIEAVQKACSTSRDESATSAW